MLKVSVHPSAKLDLDKMVKESPRVAAFFFAIIEQMSADEDFQQTLLIHHGEIDQSNIQKWITQYNQGNNLWRLKVFEDEACKYRLIYCYLLPENGISAQFCILGLVKRSEFNYGNTKPIERRIIADYQEIGEI